MKDQDRNVVVRASLPDRAAAVEELLLRFRHKVLAFITENPELSETFGNDDEEIISHSDLIVSHVRAILAVEPEEATASVAASIGRSHAEHVVKPSRYLGAYELLLSAYV